MKITIKSVLTIALVMGVGFMANARKLPVHLPFKLTVLADLTIALNGIQNGNCISEHFLQNFTCQAVVTRCLKEQAKANTGSVRNVARFDLGGASSAVTVSYDAYCNPF